MKLTYQLKKREIQCYVEPEVKAMIIVELEYCYYYASGYYQVSKK